MTLRMDANNRVADLAGTPGRRPNLAMRFGYSAALPCSARKPVEAALA